MKIRLLLITLCSLAAGSGLAAPELRWSPADTTVGLTDQATLSIMLDDTLSVRTVELFVSYDSNLVSMVSGGPGALFSGFNLFAGFEEVDLATPGQWHGYSVILGASDWTVGPGELFKWTLQGDVAGVSDLISVSVRLLPPGGGEYVETVLPGTTVIVGGVSAVGDEVALTPALTLFPNPFNPRTEIVLTGANNQAARLEVFDLRGRRVVTLWQGALPSGRSIPWDGRDAGGHSAPSGVYTFRLTGQDGQSAVARGTLLR